MVLLRLVTDSAERTSAPARRTRRDAEAVLSSLEEWALSATAPGRKIKDPYTKGVRGAASHALGILKNR